MSTGRLSGFKAGTLKTFYLKKKNEILDKFLEDLNDDSLVDIIMKVLEDFLKDFLR